MPGSDPNPQYQPPVEIADKLARRINDKRTSVSSSGRTYTSNKKCAVYESLFGSLQKELQKVNQLDSHEPQLPIPTRTEFFNYLQTQEIFKAPVNPTDLAKAITTYEQTEQAARPPADASSQPNQSLSFTSLSQLFTPGTAPSPYNGDEQSTTPQTPNMAPNVLSSTKRSSSVDLRTAIDQLQQKTKQRLSAIKSEAVELKPLREDEFMANLQMHFDKLAALDSKKIPNYVALVTATTNLISGQPASDAMDKFQDLLSKFEKNHQHSTGRKIVMGLTVLVVGILSLGIMIPTLLKSTWHTGSAKQISVMLFTLSNSPLYDQSAQSTSLPLDTTEPQTKSHQTNCPV